LFVENSEVMATRGVGALDDEFETKPGPILRGRPPAAAWISRHVRPAERTKRASFVAENGAPQRLDKTPLGLTHGTATSSANGSRPPR
jgi:hypothetical protein